MKSYILEEEEKSKDSLINKISVFLIGILISFFVLTYFSLSNNTITNAEIQVPNIDKEVSEEEIIKNTGIVYTKETVWEAWKYAYDLYRGTTKNKWVGRKSVVNAEMLTTVEIGNMTLNNQAIQIWTTMDSSGNIYEKTNASGTVKSQYEEKYYFADEDVVYYRMGASERYESLNKTLTLNEFINTYMADFTDYAIAVNKESIIMDSVEFARTSNGYKYKMDVDPSTTTELYSKLIYINSKEFTSGDMPVFKKLSITFVVGEYGHFVEIDRNEEYHLIADYIVHNKVVRNIYKSKEVFTVYDRYIEDIQPPSWKSN